MAASIAPAVSRLGALSAPEDEESDDCAASLLAKNLDGDGTTSTLLSLPNKSTSAASGASFTLAVLLGDAWTVAAKSETKTTGTIPFILFNIFRYRESQEMDKTP
jgi:hypothetical protein